MSEATEPKPQFPKAAVGAGTIYYRRLRASALLAGCSTRSALVGEGYGISSGGFAEVGDILNKSVGTVSPMLAEAWRENTEELPGIKAIIRKEDYFADAQPLLSFLVRTPDDNRVHACVYYGYEVREDEQLAIAALQPGKESKAPLQFMEISWQRNRPLEAYLPMADGLFHRHERFAFQQLAVLADKNRLWRRGVR